MEFQNHQKSHLCHICAFYFQAYFENPISWLLTEDDLELNDYTLRSNNQQKQFYVKAYPTNTNLCRKISQECVKITAKEDIILHRSYARTIPRFIFAQRSRSRPRTHQKAIKATGTLKDNSGDHLNVLMASAAFNIRK